MWERALQDIFYFIAHYVPKRLFNLETAAPQQIALFQAVMDGKRYFVIMAPRKGGKTICVAIIAVWLTLRDQTYRVFILSGGKDQAEWLYDYCKAIIWPSGGVNRERREFFKQFLVQEPTKSRIVYKLGGWIRYSAASEKQVNAPTADCLINDEFVLIPTTILEQAWPMIRQSPNPRRFLLSTARPGAENTDAFLDILDEAKKLGFKKFTWIDADCPFLQTDVALKDTEVARFFMSEEMHLTQYRGAAPKRAGRIFPRTFIRQAFVAPDPDNPGFLLDGTPFEMDPDKRIFRGEGAGGIDWGFDHDTVFIEGYRALGGKIVVMRMIVGSGTSPSDWAQQAHDDSILYGFEEWFADASGAFQNSEIKQRGLRVTSRAFQHQTRGKEWMIGISYHHLQAIDIVIPDIPEFEPLKKQLTKWKRDQNGKPKKGNDHCNDAFICLISKWDPRYSESEDYEQPEPDSISRFSANDWDSFQSPDRAWMPENWRENELLRREVWEKR